MFFNNSTRCILAFRRSLCILALVRVESGKITLAIELSHLMLVIIVAGPKPRLYVIQVGTDLDHFHIARFAARHVNHLLSEFGCPAKDRHNSSSRRCLMVGIVILLCLVEMRASVEILDWYVFLVITRHANKLSSWPHRLELLGVATQDSIM